ncbi:putative palmitoyltransferase ZDHHC24-like protein [Dinothrombium tinctorium]|nr:putative palmitoyltransferase ZDHHC24-like protein [Dinothrombium tinctorium]RWS14477.1 putative palmitoyltransferase ZDHHC24-like protein [Dinothrombium tinctorium]
MFFIWDVLGGFTAYNFMAHTFPFIFWVLGLLPFKIMVWCMISVIDVCGFMFAVGMLVYHGSLLVSNQTVYEKNKAIHKYDLKHWKANVCESLGQRWFLVWISPWLKSELPRNGIDFPSYKEYKLKSHKNK